MGSLYKSGRVRSYIMILLAVLALLISAPVKKAITRSVNNRISAFTDLLYEKTGLTISYDRLSPSILSSFYLRGIRLYDKDNELLSIDRTKINYSILNVLRGNFQKGISSIVLDGINIDVDELVELIKSISDLNRGGIDLSEIRKLVPENIKLKNINLEYNEERFDAVLSLKSLSVSNPLRRNTVELQASANLNVSAYSISKKISGKIDISGSVADGFDGSQMNLKLRNITDGEYKY